MPENTPLSNVLCLGQDHLMDLSGAALEHPVDNRSRASHAKFHLERRCARFRQKAIKGSLHSHGRSGCIVLLQCLFIWQLHVVEAHQGTQKVCIHLAHGDAGKVFIQAVELRASSGMLSLTTLSLLTGVHLDSKVRAAENIKQQAISRQPEHVKTRGEKRLSNCKHQFNAICTHTDFASSCKQHTQWTETTAG